MLCMTKLNVGVVGFHHIETSTTTQSEIQGNVHLLSFSRWTFSKLTNYTCAHAASIHEAMFKLMEVNVEMAHGVAHEFFTYKIT